MKKSLFTLAAIATVMASCTSDDLLVDNNVVNTETKQTEIGFETFNNKATRAENSTEAGQLGLIKHHSTFAVWGYKDVQTALVFNDQLVSGTAGTAAVLYTDQTAAEKNATLDGAISTTTALTADQATALNAISGVSKTDYAAGNNPTEADAILYNATLTGAVHAGDVKTPAVADKWEYTPIRFWDRNSNNYEFYAAAPQTTAAPKWVLNANGTDQNDDYFTLADVTLANSTLASTSYVESMSGQSNTDYMIASPKNVPLAEYSQAVDLDFNHILSRLNVTVKKGTTLASVGDDGKLAITSLTVYNMPAKGSFDEHLASGSTLTNGTDTRWTGASTPVLVNYTGNALADVTTTASYIMQSLIMPQTVGYDNTVTKDGKYTADKKALDTGAAPYLKIVYTIGNTAPETYTAYYNLASLFGSTGLKFSEGWQNTLNITIDADAIVFNPQVYNWEDTTAKNLSVQ